jgi:hypothetical protein
MIEIYKDKNKQSKFDPDELFFDHDSTRRIRADQNILAYVIANCDYSESAIEHHTLNAEWMNMLNSSFKSENLNHPTVRHLKQAQEIIDYYEQRFLFEILRHPRKMLSKWRKNLLSLLKTDLTDIAYEDIRILTKLPEFYHYDKRVEGILEGYNTSEPRMKDRTISETITLSFVDRTIRYTKSNKYNEYWFSTPENRVARLTVSNKNNLEVFLKSYLNLKNGKVRLHGNLDSRQFGGTPNDYFYEIKKVRL